MESMLRRWIIEAKIPGQDQYHCIPKNIITMSF